MKIKTCIFKLKFQNKKNEWNWKTEKMKKIQFKLIKSWEVTYVVRVSKLNYGHIKKIYRLENYKNSRWINVSKCKSQVLNVSKFT